MEATTSDAARRDAARSIPMDRIDEKDREKIKTVLSNVSIFRRMPVRVAECDPAFYLFLVRHPDIVVNIWELMKVSRLQLRQVDQDRFELREPAGAEVNFEYVYKSHDTHILYGEGQYSGPLMTHAAHGRGVLVLKCGYVRETNGRYYVTSRLDCFLAIEPLGVELLGKTVSPLMGKTADSNFIQTVGFVGALSRTAEQNAPGMQNLATRLRHVSPEVRAQLIDVVGDMAKTSNTAARPNHAEQTEVARRLGDHLER
ncbi:MAG: hypothetical protein ABFC77_13895 [Thermoguttaceae bacterium]